MTEKQEVKIKNSKQMQRNCTHKKIGSVSNKKPELLELRTIQHEFQKLNEYLSLPLKERTREFNI